MKLFKDGGSGYMRDQRFGVYFQIKLIELVENQGKEGNKE